MSPSPPSTAAFDGERGLQIHRLGRRQMTVLHGYGMLIPTPAVVGMAAACKREEVVGFDVDMSLCPGICVAVVVEPRSIFFRGRVVAFCAVSIERNEVKRSLIQGAGLHVKQFRQFISTDRDTDILLVSIGILQGIGFFNRAHKRVFIWNHDDLTALVFRLRICIFILRQK